MADAARTGSALPDALEIGPEAVAKLGMAQAVLDRRPQVADLAAAVVTNPGERQHVHRLIGEQRRDPVRQLDFPARPALRAL